MATETPAADAERLQHSGHYHVQGTFFPAEQFVKPDRKMLRGLFGIGAVLFAGGVYFEPHIFNQFSIVRELADQTPSSAIPYMSQVLGACTMLTAAYDFSNLINPDQGVLLNTEEKIIGQAHIFGGRWESIYKKINAVIIRQRPENALFGDVGLEVILESEPEDTKGILPKLVQEQGVYTFWMPAQANYADLAERLLPHVGK